jgi:hypothetical protein
MQVLVDHVVPRAYAVTCCSCFFLEPMQNLVARAVSRAYADTC